MGSSCQTFLRKPLQSSLLCPKRPSDPCLHPVFNLSSQHSRVLFWVWLCFKTLTSETPWVGPCWSSEEGSCCALAHANLSQKIAMWPHSSLEFMLNSSTKLMPKFAALSCIFVLMLVNRAAHWHPLGLLPLERVLHLYKVQSKQGNCFSRYSPGDPQIMLPTPGSLSSFPTGALLSLPEVTLMVGLISKTSDPVLYSLLR